MDINQLISAYTNAETALLKAFDFEQDWRVLPIDDMRKYVWTLSGRDVEWAEYEDDLGTGKPTLAMCGTVSSKPHQRTQQSLLTHSAMAISSSVYSITSNAGKRT